MRPDQRTFVLEHGWRVRADRLAHVLGVDAAAIRTLRNRAPARKGTPKAFGELFTLWHGRPPAEEDWPTPRRIGTRGGYEWLTPEELLLASFVGLHGPTDVAGILTDRLRRLTGDANAVRTAHETTIHASKLGLLQSDVLGGLTTAEAAKRAGVTKTLIFQELHRGTLRAFRVGTRHVIPVRALDDWKATRLPDPPKGWVKLWDLEKPLGIAGTSRLSWYAKNGLIPGAVFCAGHRWWIAPERAEEMLRTFRAGEPLPWHGKYSHRSVTRRSYELWLKRRHQRCRECAALWMRVGGEPRSFDEFHPRWMQFFEVQKRHLTAPDGISAERSAEQLGVDKHTVGHAIKNRVLPAERIGSRWIIRRADLRAWAARPQNMTSNDRSRSHRMLTTFRDGAVRHRLTSRELGAALKSGALHVVWQNCRAYLLRHELAALKARINRISVHEAAERAKVSDAVFLRSAKACSWRPGERITARLIYEVRRRREASWQLSFAEAAARLGRPVAWIRAAIAVGVLRPLKGVDRRQIVVGRKRVEQLLRDGIPELPPAPRRGRPVEWLQGFEACELAGVTFSTVKRWATDREIRWRPWRSTDGPFGARYHKLSVLKRARRYWSEECRFRRAQPPAWLQDPERAA